MSTQEKINGNFQTNLNAEGDQLTIQIGDDTAQIFVSKKSAREFVTDSFKGGHITLQAAQEIGSIISGAKNLQDIGPDDADFRISVTVISFGSFGFSSFFRQTMNEEQTVTPMKKPVFQVCSRCEKHGKFVDKEGPACSQDIVCKEAGYSWITWAKEQKAITAEDVIELTKQIDAQEKLAKTKEEFIESMKKEFENA